VQPPVDVAERRRVVAGVEGDREVGPGRVGELAQAGAVDADRRGRRGPPLDEQVAAGDADDRVIVAERRRREAAGRRAQPEPADGLMAGSPEDVGGDALERQAGRNEGVEADVDRATLRPAAGPRTSPSRGPRSPTRRTAMVNAPTHAAATIAITA
jgi:hypothetical protein